MKIGLKPLLLGSFIIGAILLVVAALLAFGPRNPFHSRGHFVLYLPNSAQGLDEGTAVDFAGVRVGEVDEVVVVYDRTRRRALVRIDCQIDRSRLLDARNRPIRLTSEHVLEALVGQGLRAQVQTAGIVGAQFINLDFHQPPSEHPRPEGLPASRYPVIPAVPSTMKEITDAASQILGNLKKADFAAIATQTEATLASVRRQVGQLETNRLTEHLSEAAASIDKLSASTNLQPVLLRFQDAAAALSVLMTNLNTQVVPLGGKVDQALAQTKTAIDSVNRTARDLQDFVEVRNQLGDQTSALLEQLTQTARTIERLTGFLEEHPNALISGRVPARDPHE